MDSNRDEQLREAASLGKQEAVNALLDNGAQVNSQNAVNQWTALHWAAHRGHLHIAKMLLARGADPGLLNDKGQSASDISTNLAIRDLIRHCADFSSDTFVPAYMQKLLPNDEVPQGPMPTATHTIVVNVAVDREDMKNDFVRIELDSQQDQLKNLLREVSSAYDIRPGGIVKIKHGRFLIRNDNDVKMLPNYADLLVTPFDGLHVQYPLLSW